MRAAQIENNIVVNFAEVAGFDDVSFVDPKDSVIGSKYDSETGNFLNPEPDPAQHTLRHISKLAFRNRFLKTEKAAIELAAMDVPTASMDERMQAAAIRANLADIAAAQYIDLDFKDTRDGVIALEDAGLLNYGRALEILDAQVTFEELPT